MTQSEQTTILLPRAGAVEAVDKPRDLAWLGRLGRAWAVLVVLLTCLNFALAVWTVIQTGDSSTFFTHQLFLPFLAITYTLLGYVIISHRPRNSIGWLFLCAGGFFLLVGLSASVTDGASIWAGLSPTVLNLAYWLGNWAWLPAQILPITFVFLLFPNGHLPSRRWRLVGWSAGVGLLLLAFGLAAHPGPVSDWGTAANPYGITGAEDVLSAVIYVGTALTLIGCLGSILAAIVRFRRSHGIHRAQMKWLAFTAITVLVVALLAIPLWLFGNLSDPLALELSIILSNVLTLGIAVGATVAIVSHRLYDIDVIINRTLVYVIMTGVLLLIYGLVVGAAGLLFQAQANGFVAILATALVAILFQPIRSRLQQGVNRLLYGQRDEPFAVLAELGQRLEQTVSPKAVYPTIVESVAQALRLPYVALQVRQGEAFLTVETTGRPVNDPTFLPLTNQGEIVGRLLVGRRPGDEEFTVADRRLLENIARQAGAAVYAAKLTADLQRSRQQLVTSREEERRRLRRDLHDGLGPSLASLLLEARVLRRLIRDDPATAEKLADEMQGDIRATIDDIRRVVYELRPPALDDLGLVPAIHLLADKIGRENGAAGSGDLQVQVEASHDLPLLPAAVEAAAYRIVQEALTNVVHHADARCAVVRLRLDDALHVEVVDDGIGIHGGRPGGLGLHSMRERAAELGGRCTVSRVPGGGTRVEATLPVGESQAP